MHVDDFDKLVLKNHQHEGRTLIEKGREYSEPHDRFRNFNNMAPMLAQGNTPEAAAWNAMVKHLEATQAAISKLPTGHIMPREFWKEKLGDIRIYSLLIFGMIEERIHLMPAPMPTPHPEPVETMVEQILQQPERGFSDCCHEQLYHGWDGVCPKCGKLCKEDDIPF